MSTSLAISAVTATLRNLLEKGTQDNPAGTIVTTRPPDKARIDSRNQLNIFLYQTVVSPAWRNMDMPLQVKPGETAAPPLPLNLYFLLTAYGEDDEDGKGHQVLGSAMSVLHDHPLLGPDEIEAALPGNDLHEQLERVRITPQPLSVEEISNLWNTFQSPYRISAAYQASVVLIESTRPAKAPLPVLTRGPGDEGVSSQPDLTPPFPTLVDAVPENGQPSVRLGEVLTFRGHHLDGDAVTVRFVHPRLADPIEIPVLGGGSATRISVQVPDTPGSWAAGFLTAAAVIARAGEPDRTTNELPISLAPRILAVSPDPAPRDALGDVTLQITCSPEVLPAQRVTLLLGDREIRAESHPAQTSSLTFNIVDAPSGDHFVRLRIDGVDSLLIDRTVTPPIFDASQRVTIT